MRNDGGDPVSSNRDRETHSVAIIRCTSSACPYCEDNSQFRLRIYEGVEDVEVESQHLSREHRSDASRSDDVDFKPCTKPWTPVDPAPRAINWRMASPITP